jgi:predicted RNA-binding protein with PUA-like domain
MNYWLVKSEPFKYSWDTFTIEKKTMWDGVRNYQARNSLKEMKKGDLVLWYHSNEGMEVVGVAKVATEHYNDPTIDDPRWFVVDLAIHKKFKKTVTLVQMKQEELLQSMGLLRQPRLSVMPVTKDHFDYICKLGQTVV